MTETATLTKLADFKRSGRCPCEPYQLIFYNKQSLEDYGAIVRFGRRRWLVDESRFFGWLQEHGKHAGRLQAVRR